MQGTFRLLIAYDFFIFLLHALDDIYYYGILKSANMENNADLPTLKV